MKNLLFSFAVASLVYLSSGLAQSKAAEYQQGKIVAVQKLPSQSSSTGDPTDAPLADPVDKYHISIQVGDTVYVCSYDAAKGDDKSWLTGKEREVRIKGKTMYVKRPTGGEATLHIVRTTKSNTP
jgi:co-chaperonin GroES (HSP10)